MQAFDDASKHLNVLTWSSVSCEALWKKFFRKRKPSIRSTSHHESVSGAALEESVHPFIRAKRVTFYIYDVDGSAPNVFALNHSDKFLEIL